MLQFCQTFSLSQKKEKNKIKRQRKRKTSFRASCPHRKTPEYKTTSANTTEKQWKGIVHVCPRSWPRVFANSGRARIRDTCDAVSSWGIFVPRRKPPLNYPLNTSSSHPAWWSRARRVPRQIHRNLGKISWPVKSGVLSRVTINTARTRVKLPADRPQGSDIRRKPVSGANDMPLAKSCS